MTQARSANFLSGQDDDIHRHRKNAAVQIDDCKDSISSKAKRGEFGIAEGPMSESGEKHFYSQVQSEKHDVYVNSRSIGTLTGLLQNCIYGLPKLTWCCLH